ncbi:hypothetical protein CYMTET_49414 [Cymbomonas tetramitiformis]|uniref:Purple acid phosphatase n=1 Tax=Cymbomonas tetramitiformis TaxID=36881 RepID=A0AAE0BQ79_9CHLO|nr:hypothetical protein CYMTET_49414 [Cymbomonas tetramitiformis]
MGILLLAVIFTSNVISVVGGRASGWDAIGFKFGSANCDTFKDCQSCASAKSWTGNHCRWCPLSGDESCHSEGSAYNKCDSDQQVTDASKCANLYAPVQVHTALFGKDDRGDSNGMTISWQTIGRTSSSIVKFGTVSGVRDQVARGNSSSYFATFDHHVHLTGLTAATTYYYQVGDPSTGFSQEFNFQTAPANVGAEMSFKIMVYGDLGIVNSDPTFKRLKANRDTVDLFWHLGDISYADDAIIETPLTFRYEAIYNDWMKELESIAAQKAYMVSPGNHEAECHSVPCQVSSEKLNKLGNFAAFNSRWRMPFKQSGSSSNMFYSFNFANVHFISINTETDFEGAASDHYTLGPAVGGFGDWVKWLEADLIQATKDRHLRPWIIVGGHRPVYTLITCDKDGMPSSDARALQKAMEDLFEKYQVDLYVSGHQHSYERQLPVFRGVPELQQNLSIYANPTHTTHIVAGMAGNVEAHADYGGSPHQVWNAVKDDSHYGFGRLSVINSTDLFWEFIGSDSGDVLDAFTLHRERPVDGYS